MEITGHGRLRTAFLCLVLAATMAVSAKPISKVEKWGVYEIELRGSGKGNPFTDTSLSADFINGSDTVCVKGFYDGDGTYRIRFMPNAVGLWTYRTHSNLMSLDKKSGKFECVSPGICNHGPVVVDSLKFRYADGSRYIPVGTTCYAWVHQPDSLKRQTLETLKEGYFNKMRMCVFPKSYDWNHNEPEYYPFEGEVGQWDYTRFNPQYFRNIEDGILALNSLGIEADIIVFHPYDRWGFSTLDLPTRDRYMDYIISRFGAYKNVWWSMANEYDFMDAYNEEDWNHHLDFFCQS